MESVIVKRALMVLTGLIIIVGSAVACNFIIGEDDSPTVSNKDEIFLTYKGIEITKGDLYGRMLVTDGMLHLVDYIDRHLLADEMDAVTEDEIDEMITVLKYGTTDQDEIDRMTEEEIEELESEYRDLIVMSGYDPDDPDSEDAFIRLRVAKENYTRSRYETAEENDPFFITEDDLERFYEDYYQGDLMAIRLRFNNQNEFLKVFKHFNLVHNYEGGIGLYEGEEPIENVRREDFDEENTRLLDDEEVLTHYIKLYNYIYPYRETIDEEKDRDDLLELDEDFLRFNQRELQELAAERDELFFAKMSDFLYHDIDDDRPYSINSKSIEGNRYIAHVLQRDEITPFEDLDEEELDTLRADYIDTLVGDEETVRTMAALHEESGLRIYDQAVSAVYQQQFEPRQSPFEEPKDNKTIAEIDDMTITADDLYDYMVQRIGILYAIELTQEKYLLHSDYYEDLFGRERDVLRNRSDLMRDYRRELSETKQQVAEFGFDWQLYLALYMRVGSDREMIEQRAARRLRMDYLHDLVDVAMIHPYVEEQFENYFSLDVERLVIYLDHDEDRLDDNLEEYLDSLEPEERSDFESLMGGLESLIMSESEDEDLEDIVKEYNEALRGEDEDADDYSQWARFKNAGIRLRFENLGELTYKDAMKHDEDFIAKLQTMYARYTEDYEDEDKIYSDGTKKTEFGYHFILARQGKAFVKPSARLIAEDLGDYHEDFLNDDDIPTVEQMALYSERELDRQRYGESDIEIPGSVRDALDVYYKDAHSRLYGSVHHSIITLDNMLAGDVEIAKDEEHHLRMAQTVRDLFMRMHFPELED